MRVRRPPSFALTDWPAYDDGVLSKPERADYRRRRRAVEAYAKGKSLSGIEKEIGIPRSTILRLVKRAQSAHFDGRIWGFRALVPYSRVRPYERGAPPKVLINSKAGNAGAFSQLLARHPKLYTHLRGELVHSRVTLKPSSDPKGRLSGVKAASMRFQSACRDLGLSARDYPLNQQDKATRSLARTLRDWLDDDFQMGARSAGALTKPASALRQLPERGASDAFDTVEFDAHKMDVRLKIIDRDPLGNEQSFEIERVWLLAIIDVTTRCILGFRLSLKRECDRFDVIETIKRALIPIDRPELILPGLRLLPSGGFVSESIEQTQYAIWRQIRLDNAKAHLATNSLDVLCEALGCTADFGPAYSPDDRPFIERFFGTVTTTLSRRLPGAIPHKPMSPKEALKRLRDPSDLLRLIVTPQELEELLLVTVWNYHGTPHSGLGGLTPLETMQRHVLGIGRNPVRLRLLPTPLRERPELLHDPVLARVRGNQVRGERPHITFFHVRYTSHLLARRSDLAGQQLRIYFNPNDLRTIIAYTEDGHSLDELMASGPWLREPHSLRLRQQIFKARRAGMLNFDGGDNQIESFLALRRTQARKRKRAASDIAQVQTDRAASRAPINPSTPEVSPPLTQLVTGKVSGKNLRIIRGFAR